MCSKHKHIDPDEHTCNPASCTSNIPFDKNIGDEYSWAMEAFEDLQNDGLNVVYVTTDPDSSAYKAADDLAIKEDKTFQVHHLIDTRHMSQNHRKKMKKDNQLHR